MELSYRSSCVMMNNKTPFSGELRDDACIHWSDGDIWSRHEDPVESRICMEVPTACQGDNEFTVSKVLSNLVELEPAVARAADLMNENVDLMKENVENCPYYGKGIKRKEFEAEPRRQPSDMSEGDRSLIQKNSKEQKYTELWAEITAMEKADPVIDAVSKSDLPGRLDRISVDTADLDNKGAGALKSICCKKEANKPRKEKGMCCC